MSEGSGFGFGDFYQKVRRAYDAALPVSHDLIGERKTPNASGQMLELVSVGRLLYARLMKGMGLQYLDKRVGHTDWEEHEETAIERERGLMTELGQFDFTLAFTAADRIRRTAPDRAEESISDSLSLLDSIRHGRDGAVRAGELPRSGERETADTPISIESVQNKVVSQVLYNAVRHTDRTGEGDRHLPRVATDKVYGDRGRLVDVEPHTEYTGWPFTVWIMVSDEDGTPYGFRPVTFRKPAPHRESVRLEQDGQMSDWNITNPFDVIDWSSAVRGGDIAFAIGSVEGMNIVESGEIHYLDEFHNDLPYEPDFIVGIDTPNRRITNLTRARTPRMIVGMGLPHGRSATIKLSMPTHRPYIGVDIAGRLPTERDRRALPSIIEATIAHPDVSSLIDDSPESVRMNEEALEFMGEYGLQVTSMESTLQQSFPSAGEPDLRQQMEDVLTVSQLSEHPSLRKFAEITGIYKAHKTFRLTPIINQAMLDVPKMKVWKEQGLMGVVLPALAAGLTVEQIMGIDMALPGRDMTMAPTGFELYADVRRMVDGLTDTENPRVFSEKMQLLEEYRSICQVFSDGRSLADKITYLRNYCEHRGAVFGVESYEPSDFWDSPGKHAVERLEKELVWLTDNSWILDDSEESARLFDNYLETHHYLIATPETATQLEHLYWVPLIAKYNGIAEALRENEADQLDDVTESRIQRMIAQMYQVWSNNYSLPDKTFTETLAGLGIQFMPGADPGSIQGIERNRQKTIEQTRSLIRMLLRGSYKDYHDAATHIHLEPAIKHHFDVHFINYDSDVYSPDTMMPLATLREVAEGRRRGATGVNAELGSWRVLEPISIKGGAAGVPSTLRFGGHFSRIISTAGNSMRKRTGVTLAFSTAGGAKGTTEVFAQINDMFDYKKIFTEPRNVMKLFLPILRSNGQLRSAFMGYINHLSKDEMSEADKSLLIDMLAGTDTNEWGDYRASRPRGSAGGKSIFEESARALWKRDTPSRRILETNDARTKVLENTRAATLFEAFASFTYASESGEYYSPEIQQWLTEFRSGGFVKAVDAHFDKTIAEFEANLAALLIVFARMAEGTQPLHHFDFSGLERSMYLRKARLDALDRAREADVRFAQTALNIGGGQND